VHFVCDVVANKMSGLLAAGLENKLKLSTKISTGAAPAWVGFSRGRGGRLCGRTARLWEAQPPPYAARPRPLIRPALPLSLPQPPQNPNPPTPNPRTPPPHSRQAT
jgi:hypothetical protein